MVTPLMRQYGLLKESVPGAVLLYRLGDFYEMFYEDAKVANRVLGITLTARAKDDERIPMAGFPHHASLPYVRKLLAAGHRVAVCEQVEDPASARGVVRREVVRVFSPGTLLEDGLLEERRANHLLAIAPERGHLGLAWAELSTGHVLLDEILPEELEDALARIDPSECVLPEAAPEAIVRALGGAFRGVVTRRSSIDFDREGAERRLREQYRVAALDAFGCDGMPHALRAAGALLGYLAETQRGALAHLHAPRRLGREGVMILDRATLRGLEVLASARDGGADGTLLATLDATRTAVGARLLRAWVLRPLTDPSRLVLRHDAVGWFAGDAALRGEIRDLLGKVYDLERIAGRLGTSRANPRDLMGLCESLRSAGAIRDRLGDRAPALVAELARGIPSGGEELASRIAATLVAEPPQTHLEGGVIAPGVDPGIDELRTLLVDGDSWLDRFREEESRRTGIPSLKVVRHRVFGYSIEVTNTHRARVPEGYVRQQTMKNAERYTTSALKTQEERILTARGRLCALESERFEALRAHAAQGVRDIQGVAGAIGALDVLCAFGQAAAERGYVRPEIVQEPVLQVRSGRHPVLDRLLGGSFVPNDMDLRPDRLVQIVTGPNMAGKSTYIRTAGLLVLMAQAGSFVPAASMRLGCADRVFARVGAADDLSRGASTFMVEMSEAANILRHATGRSLVILDEIGRGTSTYDGLSIARAIAEDLASRIRSRTLFATHYHEMTSMASEIPGVVNLNVEVREWQGQVVFLHRIVDGAADRSYGIHVAQLAGLPRGVLSRARRLLALLERGAPALPGAGDPAQIPLFGVGAQDDPESAIDPLRARLAGIEVEKITPIEAMRLLDELARQAREGRASP